MDKKKEEDRLKQQKKHIELTEMLDQIKPMGFQTLFDPSQFLETSKDRLTQTLSKMKEIQTHKQEVRSLQISPSWPQVSEESCFPKKEMVM